MNNNQNNDPRERDDWDGVDRRKNPYTTNIVESKITIKDVIGLFVFIGGLVTSWVNLNNNLTMITIKQEETFKYFEKRLSGLEDQEKTTTVLIGNVNAEINKKISDVEAQYEDLDRTISKIYQETLHSKK